MSAREVWTIRKVEADWGWGLQAVTYTREPREDGLLLWKLGRTLSEVLVRSLPNTDRLIEVGNTTGLPHDTEARHGGVAINIGDLLLPEEETVWRLEGVAFKLVWCRATKARPFTTDKKAPRLIIGLARKVSGRWLFERRIATVSHKQSGELVARLGLDFHEVKSMPRTKGRPVPVNQDT